MSFHKVIFGFHQNHYFQKKFDLLKTVIDETSGRVPIIMNTSEESTHYTIEMSKRAQEMGASGLMIKPPGFDGAQVSSIEKHFEDAFEAYKLLNKGIDRRYDTLDGNIRTCRTLLFKSKPCKEFMMMFFDKSLATFVIAFNIPPRSCHHGLDIIFAFLNALKFFPMCFLVCRSCYARSNLG